jgi:hypothetical protein
VTPNIEEFVRNKLGAGIDRKYFLGSRENLYDKLKCGACPKVVSPGAVYCNQCLQLFCPDCFHANEPVLKCQCKDNTALPIYDSITGKLEVQE